MTQLTIRKQIEQHFGFEVLLARTEVGGYCPHCQALREQEMKEADESRGRIGRTTG